MNRNRLRHRFLKPINIISIANVMLLALLPFSFAGFKSPTPAFIRLPTFGSGYVCAPEVDHQIIYITKDEKIFLEIEMSGRDVLLGEVSKKYGVAYTDGQREAFGSLHFIGTDIRQLPQLLNNAAGRSRQAGIPVELNNNQLKEWMSAIKQHKSTSRFFLYADEDLPYSGLKKVLNTFQDVDVSRFNLVLDIELHDNG